MKKIVVTSIGACLVFLLVATLPPGLGAQTTFKWKIGLLYPRASDYYKVYHKFCEDVKAMSGGRLVIDEVYDGEGVPAPELFGAVKTGLLEMAQPWMPIHAGELPVGEIEAGLPGGPTVFAGLLAMYRESKLTQVFRKAYAGRGIEWLGDAFQPACYALTKKKITSLDDFKRMKLRAVGAYGKMMRQLGASPVTLAFGEVYTSLATGVVDGVVGAQILDFKAGKFYEVAKYLFPVPIAGYQAAPFLVNAKAWNKLPEDLKAVVKAAFDTHIIEMRLYCLLWEQNALSEMKSQGLKIGPMITEAEKARWFEAGKSVWGDYAKADQTSQDAIEAMTEFIKQYNLR
ncbi:MAG: TRAP transporter substrate-binding protein DctP [Deltaproteobacteria bacterium]|nr:TRAP transporter substrate-binding protein DctP [Deltaproteobacteria bacterium]